MGRFTRGSLLLLILFIGSGVGAQPPPIQVSASPRYSAEPSTVSIILRIPKDPLNRYVDLVLEAENYYSASSFSHLPTSPQILQLFRPSIPAGNYTIFAILHRSDRSTHRAEAPPITVLERVP